MFTNALGMYSGAQGVSYSYATWNPSDAVNATLTNGNKTIAATTSSSTFAARGTQGISSGKHYYELTVGPSGSATASIGFANSSHTLSSSASANNIIANTAGGVYNGGAFAGAIAAVSAGNVLGFYLDADNKIVKIYHNGIHQGSYTYTFANPVYAFYNCGDNGTGNSGIANFGSSPMRFQAPSCCNNGIYTASGLPSFATWNASDKGGGITLSDSNLKATVSTVSIVRSTISKSSGKWYWEVTRIAGTDNVIGVAKSGASLTLPLGGDANGWGYIGSNGQKYNNATSLAYGTAYSDNSIIGVALDLDNGTLSFFKDGVSQGVAYSGLSGTFFAAFGTGNSTDSCFANFGQYPFAYAPPAGFSYGLAATTYTPTINYATWNASDKGAAVNLSNGNLTAATVGGFSSGTGVRATQAKVYGKWYWEIKKLTVNNSDYGIASINHSLTQWLGSGADGIALDSVGGIWRYNTNQAGTVGHTTNDIIGVALDPTYIKFYKNGAYLNKYSHGFSTVPLFPAIADYSTGSDSTVNFGATPLVYAPPSGYSWGVADQPVSFSRSYATWNPSNVKTGTTLTNSNLTMSVGGLGVATLGKSSGKWYWEVSMDSNTQYPCVGICTSAFNVNSRSFPGDDANSWGYYGYDGGKYTSNTYTAYGAAYASSTPQVIGVALDMDAGTVTFYKNGVSQGQAFSGLSGTIYPANGMAISTTGTQTANFGQTPFAYPAPAGFKGLY